MAVNKKIPQRQCVGCGENKDKKSMMRVIKTGENEILLDDTGKKNGRGAYICKTMDCLKKAMKNKGLERSLKTRIPETVYDELLKEMKSYEE
ncbi:MAG: RNase P modulator RnpM [Butyrivibrio sp.]